MPSGHAQTMTIRFAHQAGITWSDRAVVDGPLVAAVDVDDEEPQGKPSDGERDPGPVR